MTIANAAWSPSPTWANYSSLMTCSSGISLSCKRNVAVSTGVAGGKHFLPPRLKEEHLLLLFHVEAKYWRFCGYFYEFLNRRNAPTVLILTVASHLCFDKDFPTFMETTQLIVSETCTLRFVLVWKICHAFERQSWHVLFEIIFKSRSWNHFWESFAFPT